MAATLYSSRARQPAELAVNVKLCTHLQQVPNPLSYGVHSKVSHGVIIAVREQAHTHAMQVVPTLVLHLGHMRFRYPTSHREVPACKSVFFLDRRARTVCLLLEVV